jgi:LysM repeat protein
MAKLTSNTSGNFRTYGIKTVGSERRRHAGLYRIFAVLLFLIVCAAVVWGVVRHNDRRNSISTDLNRPVPDNETAALTFAEERAAAENAETAAAILEHRQRENHPDAASFDLQAFERERLKQQKKLYDEALQAFNERKFEECRSILRDMLVPMDSSDSLYDPAANLLGRASLNLYRSGVDSETNVDYTVKSGDTLSKIAVNYNTSVSAIQKANGMTTTRLNIDQKLKIPQSVWSIVIRRADNKLILYANNRIFKIYNVYPGSAVSQSFSGTFRIFSKQKDPVWRVDGQTYQPGSAGNIIGSRWMALKGTGASANAAGTAIHGTNRAGTPDTSPGAPGYFRMSNADAIELYELVPCETIVEIKGGAH